MMRSRLLMVVLFVVLGMPVAGGGQSLSKVVTVDFEKVVVESVEGKKSSDQFNVKLNEAQKELEDRQKEIQDLTNQLRTQERVLSDARKAELQRDIDRKQTDLTRFNEDKQKDLAVLRDELLKPISDVATQILQAYAAQQGFTLIIDLSSPQNDVLWRNPKSDITDDLIKLVNAQLAKQPAAPATPAPAPAPATRAPAPRPPAAPAPNAPPAAPKPQ